MLRILLLLGALIALTACSPSTQKFNNADVTGADFGKDFSLYDHRGQLRSLADFRGKAVIMFFGYTQCPDVCPTTMTQFKQVRQQLGEEAKRTQVLFVTVDPERDTQALLAQYVPAFDPSFLGMRGDAQMTAKVAKDFKVFYQKVAGATPGSYTMDHSAGGYVFDPEGRLRLFIRHGAGPEPLAADLRLLLAGK